VWTRWGIPESQGGDASRLEPGTACARRADAASNLELLLTAAREAIDQSGSDLVMDEVARRAGVGHATLYRNFPTRADLLVAVYQDEIDELCSLGADLQAEPSPAEALFAWMDALVVHIATKRTGAGSHRRRAAASCSTAGTPRSPPPPQRPCHARPHGHRHPVTPPPSRHLRRPEQWRRPGRAGGHRTPAGQSRRSQRPDGPLRATGSLDDRGNPSEDRLAVVATSPHGAAVSVDRGDGPRAEAGVRHDH
jgi:AcrR family transcriptional regulator